MFWTNKYILSSYTQDKNVFHCESFSLYLGSRDNKLNWTWFVHSVSVSSDAAWPAVFFQHLLVCTFILRYFSTITSTFLHYILKHISSTLSHYGINRWKKRKINHITPYDFKHNTNHCEGNTQNAGALFPQITANTHHPSATPQQK